MDASIQTTSQKGTYWNKTQETLFPSLLGGVKQGQDAMGWEITFFPKVRYVCNGII